MTSSTGSSCEDDRFRLTGAYTGVPHNFGNGGKSLLAPVLENEWRIADTTQAGYQNAIAAAGNNTSYAFLSALVQPGLDAAPANIDLKLQRNRGSLALDFTPGEGRFDVGVTYLHERRSGTRAANGTSFGFNNVIETPEPLRYITQDFGVNATYKGDWGSVRAGVNFNDFTNTFDSFIFDNPFRESPPAVSNPVFGRTSLPPDNKATTESVGGDLQDRLQDPSHRRPRLRTMAAERGRLHPLHDQHGDRDAERARPPPPSRCRPTGWTGRSTPPPSTVS